MWLYKKLILFIFFAVITVQVISQEKSEFEIKVLDVSDIFSENRFEECHASTIAETSPGVFISSWFAGSYEGADDVGIWIAEYRNSAWSDPSQIAKGSDASGNPLPCWNPVLFMTQDGMLYLFYKVGPNPREWWGCFIKSSDNGKTWSDPENLPDGFLGPIKNKPIQLDNGNILCPSSIETIDGKWTVHLEITDSDLSNWKKIEIDSDSSVKVIQPSIIRHEDGRLQMLCRSDQNFIFETWSNDEGFSWSELQKTAVHNPNSGIDAVCMKSGNILLIYNPLAAGENWWNGRNQLNIAHSQDGILWRDIYQLENEKEGEFSYPAVIQADDGLIHITYTSMRKMIKHVVLKIGGITK
jgi:alpha-L-fucosidase